MEHLPAEHPRLPAHAPGSGQVLHYHLDHYFPVVAVNLDTGETIRGLVPRGVSTLACAHCANKLIPEGAKVTDRDTYAVGDRFYCGHCLKSFRSTHSAVR